MTSYAFLLDEDGKVIQHCSYALAAATGAINAHLGVAAEPPRYKPTEAG